MERKLTTYLSAAADRRSALVVADARGHIIERIGRSWQRHGQGVDHEMAIAGESSSFTICQRARRVGMVHWLDQIAYLALGKAVRAPQVVMVHHLTDDSLEQGISALGHCDGIATSSLRWQAKLATLTRRRVTHIPYSIDTQGYRPPVNRADARAAEGIGAGRFVIGFVGKADANQANRKGIDLLETVLRNGARRWRNLCALLVGPGWETLGARLQQAGVQVVRRQYQKTEQTAAAYGVMDALLVTSSEEGGPCTILEAMACGTPVITSDVGHVPEVVTDGVTGLICPTRSAQEYLERIERLREGGQLWGDLSAAGLEFVRKERDDAVVVPRIDFKALYGEAEAHFRAQSRLARAARALPSAYLYARSLARPLRRLGATA